MTERLYLDDSYATTFRADVIQTLHFGDEPAVVLEKTLFYPTSGGQLHDTGVLNDVAVVSVIDEGDTILHVLSEPIDSPAVRGRIDWIRRFDNMQQHTGQHILSQSILRTRGAETVSASLGSESATIDIDARSFSFDDARRAEEEANTWVCLNVPVTILYPSEDELEKMPLRKMPPRGKRTRIVNIESLDFSPCGGTHCSRTGEVGIVKIGSWGKVRSRIRLEFFCGFRALNDYQIKSRIISSLTRTLSTAEADIPESVEKHLESTKSRQRELQELKNRLSEYRARELFESGWQAGDTRIIARAVHVDSVPDLQLLAQKIRSCGECAAVLGGTENHAFVMTCTGGIPIDLTECLQSLKKSFDVKGGGGSTMVQGAVTGKTNLIQFIEAAGKEIMRLLSR